MSTPYHPPAAEHHPIEVLHNDDEGTVTFVADRDDGPGTPTEWITIANEDAADVADRR